MRQATLTAALVLCAAALGSAHAQGVYRCGNEYGSKPCPGGAEVQADDSRTGAQAKAATDKAKYEAKLAKDMERDRLAQEKRAGGPTKVVTGVPPAASPAAPASAAKHAKKKGHGKGQPEFFTAVAPKKPAEKKEKAKKTSG